MAIELSQEEAYAIACRLLGEALVRESVLHEQLVIVQKVVSLSQTPEQPGDEVQEEADTGSASGA